MKRVLLATILGAITLFAWQFVSRMHLKYYHDTISPWPGKTEEIESVLKGFTESGAYQFPDTPTDSAGRDKVVEYAKNHPVAKILIVKKAGSEVLTPKMFAIAFGLHAASALLASLVLLAAGVGALNIGRRFLIIFLLGVFAAVAVQAPYWVWLGFPDKLTLVAMGEVAVGWFLAAIVMSIVFRRPKEQPAEA